MSYARWSEDSAVYVYADVGGYVACCGCSMGDKWDFHSPAEIVAHLQEHVAAGHKVPAYLLDEDLYPPDDFVAMCGVFLCREPEGHGGEHTPVKSEQYAQIRAHQLGALPAPVPESTTHPKGTQQ